MADTRGVKYHRAEGEGRRTEQRAMPPRDGNYRGHNGGAAQDYQRPSGADPAVKKEVDAMVEYFTSVENALIAVSHAARNQEAMGVDAVEDGGAPQLGPAMVLDGFCTELTKRLARDATTLLTNRIACRVLELALSCAEPQHVRAIAYALLGKIAKMAMSPTASFVVETLLASLYHMLGLQMEKAATGVAEPEGGDDAGGLPPLGELLILIIDEIVDVAPALLWERGGAKCLAAGILVCAGFPVRSVPQNAYFTAPALVERLFSRLQNVLAEPSVVGTRNSFADCCIHVSACFVIQALIRAANVEDVVAQAATLKPFIAENMAPILPQLLQHTVGSRVVECYASTGDKAAWDLVLNLSQEALTTGNGFVPEFAILSLIDGITDFTMAESLWNAIFASSDEVLGAWVRLRQKVPVDVKPKPHPLTRFVEALAPPAEPADEAKAKAKAAAAKKAFKAQAAWVVDVPPTFRRELCDRVAKIVRAQGTKGPVHALVIEGIAGNPAGGNLLAALLAMGRAAASTIIHAFDKLLVDDLPKIAASQVGSLCLQRYADCIAAESAVLVQPDPAETAAAAAKEASDMPLTGAALRLAYKERDKKAKASGTDGLAALRPRLPPPPPAVKAAAPAPVVPKPAVPVSPLLRFTRRLLVAVLTLAKDKYASFVLQHIYALGAIDVRRDLCQALANHYADLKLDFIASKLMVHCCVEQFLYRPDEWKAQSARQTHVRKVMAVVLAAEAAFASRQGTAPDNSAPAADGDGKAKSAKAAQRDKRVGKRGGKAAR